MRALVMLPSLVRTISVSFFSICNFLAIPFSHLHISIHLHLTDDGKLKAESDSGEFWVLFGGFAPIGKKVVTEDDIIAEKTSPQLFR